METYQTEKYRGCTISICYDTDCESPRTSNDYNLSHMICWHRHYNIGDDHEYSDESVFFDHLVRQYVSYDAIKDFILAHKGDCWLEKQEECYILHDGENDYYDAQYELDADVDAIAEQAIDYLSDQDKYTLVEASDELVISTISYYDHSGVTVWIGSPNDRWDSGRAGWIYQTKKDTIEQNGGTEENWRDVAWKNMEAEMKEYDAFVRGECFGYITEDEEGEHIDSCWGFVGTDCIDEMISEAKDVIDYRIKQIEEKRNNLVNYMTANFEKLPEGQIFVDVDKAYRADRNNLFHYLQLTSAPIKNNIVGVFDTIDIPSVPTEMLECMKSTIDNPQTVNAI